jgi:hypothetical protein
LKLLVFFLLIISQTIQANYEAYPSHHFASSEFQVMFHQSKPLNPILLEASLALEGYTIYKRTEGDDKKIYIAIKAYDRKTHQYVLFRHVDFFQALKDEVLKGSNEALAHLPHRLESILHRLSPHFLTQTKLIKFLIGYIIYVGSLDKHHLLWLLQGELMLTIDGYYSTSFDLHALTLNLISYIEESKDQTSALSDVKNFLQALKELLSHFKERLQALDDIPKTYMKRIEKVLTTLEELTIEEGRTRHMAHLLPSFPSRKSSVTKRDPIAKLPVSSTPQLSPVSHVPEDDESDSITKRGISSASSTSSALTPLSRSLHQDDERPSALSMSHDDLVGTTQACVEISRGVCLFGKRKSLKEELSIPRAPKGILYSRGSF